MLLREAPGLSGSWSIAWLFAHSKESDNNIEELLSLYLAYCLYLAEDLMPDAGMQERG